MNSSSASSNVSSLQGMRIFDLSEKKKRPDRISDVYQQTVDDDVLPTGSVRGPSVTLTTDRQVELLQSLKDGKSGANPTEVFQQLFQTASEEELQSFYARMLSGVKTDPALFLKLQKQHPFPFFAKIRPQTQALEKLAKEARELADKALQEARRTKDTKQRLSAMVKFNDLDKKAQDLAQRAKESKAKEETLNKKWDKKLRSYYETLLKFLENPENFQAIYDQFIELRRLQPQSFSPFLPFVTIFTNRLDDESLTDFFFQASECDPYLTYAATLFFSRLRFQPHVLEVLRNSYPEDIVLGPFIEATKGGSTKITLDLQKVSKAVESSLNDLIAGKIDQAIGTLVHVKPLLMGFSLIHRYLALAWALKGDAGKALSLEKRASGLPSIEEGKIIESDRLMSRILTMLDLMFPKSGAPKKREFPTLLEKFIKLTENPQGIDCSTACTFIDEAKDVLQSSHQHLPMIYLGVRWLTSRLILPSNGFEVYKPLYSVLFDLLTIVAGRVDEPDSWFLKHFEKQVQGNSFTFFVSFPGISFGNPPDSFPIVKFQGQSLELTRESLNSLALSVTKQVHGLILGILSSHAIAQSTVGCPKLPPADNPTIFLRILRAGFNAGLCKDEKASLLSCQALYSLKRYLKSPPYPLETSVLSWAKFCVFSHYPCENLNSPLQEEVRNLYYPADFLFQSEAMKDSKHSSLALRDVSLAWNRLQKRSIEPQTVVLPKGSIYAVFELSQQLFGWRLNESFEDWGKRLAKEAKSGFFAPGCYLNKPKSKIKIEISVGAEKAVEILRSILGIWVDFYKKTSEKNARIADGENEDKSGTKESPWHKDVTPNLWKSIIEGNTPQDYPSYHTLVKKDRETLVHLIEKKHVHVQEVKELRKKTFSSEIEGATLLLFNAEGKHREVSHNIFVASEKIACNIYHILLEVAAERQIRHAIIAAGPTIWVPLDAEKTMQVLSPALDQLTGAFHGPEVHLSGEGPLQQHYNAGSASSKLVLENTHIYF